MPTRSPPFCEVHHYCSSLESANLIQSGRTHGRNLTPSRTPLVDLGAVAPHRWQCITALVGLAEIVARYRRLFPPTPTHRSNASLCITDPPARPLKNDAAAPFPSADSARYSILCQHELRFRPRLRDARSSWCRAGLGDHRREPRLSVLCPISQANPLALIDQSLPLAPAAIDATNLLPSIATRRSPASRAAALHLNPVIAARRT